MRDLFGNEVTEAEARDLRSKAKGKRRTTKARGYAALPGTGPAGETCASCRHIYRKRLSRTYIKCELMAARWTGGGASDIQARSPACLRWEAPVAEHQEGDHHRDSAAPEDQPLPHAAASSAISS
jgi:hypothetical protein